MIDIRNTILSTINCKIDRLRILAENDPKAYKKILSLIILKDLEDWAVYLGDCDDVLKRIQSIITNYMYNNKDFVIKYFPKFSRGAYTNTNIPLTNDTFRRVFDKEDVIDLSEYTSKEEETGDRPTSFTPDYTCGQNLIIMKDTDNVHPGEYEPEVTNWDDLTTCDMMNFYFDTDNSNIWYLDPATCLWKLLKTNQTDPDEQVVKEMVESALDGKTIHHTFGTDTTEIVGNIDLDESNPQNIGILQDLDEEDEEWLQ